ncbi:MAG: DUF1822 family protein [Microcoleaceae cyanobacterium]
MLTDLLNDFAHEFIELDNTIETIALETEQIDTALQQSQTVKSEQQWSVYLSQLAQFGLENWLQKREPQLTVIPGELIPSLESIVFLQLGEFKLCLIPSNGMSEPEIIIPRAVIELPEFAAHFYVPVGVAEDLELIGILGFLTYNQLAEEASQIQPLIDWTYAIPREDFNPDTDELLLNLQCLSPSTIPLPAIPDNRQAELAAVKTQLETLLPQATNRPLWQVLDWTEAKALLTHSSLLNWLNDAQPSLAISEVLQLLTQPIISVGKWLQNQLDEVSQSLAWQPLALPMRGFLSTLAPSASPVAELEDILNQLQSQYQIQVPPEAACRRENLPNDIQLYAITWRRPQNEWALLLIATTSSEAVSPSAMQWRISDENQVLIDRKLSPEAGQTYLFTQIVGEIGEKFLVNFMIDNYPQIARVFMF